MLADETRSWHGNTAPVLQHAGQQLRMIAHSLDYMMKCFSCFQTTTTWTGLYESARSTDESFACEYSVELESK